MNIYIYVAKKESCVIKYISKNYIIVNIAIIIWN